MVTFKEISKRHHKLYENNLKQIKEYNNLILPRLSFTAALILSIAFIASFIFNTMESSRYLYGLSAGLSFVVYLLSRYSKNKELTTILLYIQFVSVALLLIVISVVKTPDVPASMALVIIAIFPIVFADKLYRILLADFSIFLVFIILSITYKTPDLAQADLINGLFSCIIGLFLSHLTIDDKLRSFDYHRKLKIEMETDALTHLANRHKLFDVVKKIDEEHKLPIPNSVIMLDVDLFKKYNDTYGHMAGDECLSSIGKVIHSEEIPGKIEFFRFGGEEFCGFLWNVTQKEAEQIALRIQKKASNITTLKEPITISLGYTYLTNSIGYELAIKQADVALYQAKANGRNQVCYYNDIKTLS